MEQYNAYTSISYRLTGFTIRCTRNVAILDIRGDGFGVNEKDEPSAGNIAMVVNIPYARFRPS